jgi:hypothetical protein
MDKGKVTQKGLSIFSDAGAYCPARKSLQCDKLAFKQGAQFFPIGNMIGGVCDQHQCCKFVGAQHGMLLMQREKRWSSANAGHWKPMTTHNGGFHTKGKKVNAEM